jgi:hypothetical protein
LTRCSCATASAATSATWPGPSCRHARLALTCACSEGRGGSGRGRQGAAPDQGRGPGSGPSRALRSVQTSQVGRGAESLGGSSTGAAAPGAGPPLACQLGRPAGARTHLWVVLDAVGARRAPQLAQPLLVRHGQERGRQLGGLLRVAPLLRGQGRQLLGQGRLAQDQQP